MFAFMAAQSKIYDLYVNALSGTWGVSVLNVHQQDEKLMLITHQIEKQFKNK